MNKILLFIIFFPLVALGQNSPTSFWGIPFGSSSDSVKAIVYRNHKKTLNFTKDKDGFTYSCADCIFAMNEAEIILFGTNEGLYSGYVLIEPKNIVNIISEYTEIKEGIQGKWGKPITDVESYKYPYKKGDGHELYAIKGGYATIGAVWRFINSASILVYIKTNKIIIVYNDGDLSESVKNSIKEKTDKDY
jgi:hypothetical protein